MKTSSTLAWQVFPCIRNKWNSSITYDLWNGPDVCGNLFLIAGTTYVLRYLISKGHVRSKQFGPPIAVITLHILYCPASKSIACMTEQMCIFLHRLLDSLVVDCWHRVREVPGLIPSQGPRHTKDVIKNCTSSSLV